MAHPGYPMQQPPMQPMQGMQPPGPGPMAVRRGTSKAVPVVVSAGLAIGVFCGLAAGLGFDTEEASAESSSSTTTAKTETKPDNDVPEPFQPKPNDVKPPPKADGSASGVTKPPETGSGSAVASAGSGSAAGSGSGSGSAATVPPKIMGKLTVVVKPEAAAKVAKIYIDGTQLESNVYELDLTESFDKTKKEARKSVDVLVKASGFKEKAGKVEIVGAPNADTKTSYEIELQKKPAATGGQLPRPQVPNSGGNKPKCKKPPCGLIDI